MFTTRFQEHWLAGMRDKLGLVGNEEGDLELARAFSGRCMKTLRTSH